MKMSKALQQAHDKAIQTSTYWVDKAKLDFSLLLESERRNKCLNYSEFANALHTSPAYISKVFRGDANLTIESMAKLLRAVGMQLHFSAAPLVTSAQIVTEDQTKLATTQIIATSIKTESAFVTQQCGIPQRLVTRDHLSLVSSTKVAYRSAGTIVTEHAA